MQKTIVFLVSVILLVGLVSIGFASTYTPFALNEDDDGSTRTHKV